MRWLSGIFVFVIAGTIIACGGGGSDPLPAPMPSAPQHTASPGVTVLPTPLIMPGLNRQRTIRVYVPPAYASSTKRYPVLYMHDGQNLFDAATSYAGEWGVDETLDGLAASKGLEIIVVGIDNGLDKRMTELNAWDNAQYGVAEGRQYMDFIVDVVKPMIDTTYRTKPERQFTGVMGSSMGGLISQYAIQQYASTFSKAGIFSPSYWAAPAVYGFTASTPPASDARLYVYMGGQEGDVGTVDSSDRMVAQLQAQGHPAGNLVYRINPTASHNEAAWRAEFMAAVSWLFTDTP